jgi:hypothetical protein
MNGKTNQEEIYAQQRKASYSSLERKLSAAADLLKTPAFRAAEGEDKVTLGTVESSIAETIAFVRKILGRA